MPPAYVKPYVKRQKNDAADAEAISEAVTRANMRFVPIKTPEQQSGLMLHRTRHLLIRQQTSVINAIRAHLAEFGIVAPVGAKALRTCWVSLPMQTSKDSGLIITRTDDTRTWTASMSRRIIDRNGSTMSAQSLPAPLRFLRNYEFAMHSIGPVVVSERGGPMTPLSIVVWFARAFEVIGLDGCSSHSGRRTFITRAARLVHKAGGSLRDVQVLAGHRSIQTTQRYIDGDSDAQRKLVSLI